MRTARTMIITHPREPARPPGARRTTPAPTVCGRGSSTGFQVGVARCRATLLGFKHCSHSSAQWRAMFPYLPDQPGYHKRLKNAQPLLCKAILALAACCPSWCDDLWMTDATAGALRRISRDGETLGSGWAHDNVDPCCGCRRTGPTPRHG